jgi:hypothetical protein
VARQQVKLLLCRARIPLQGLALLLIDRKQAQTVLLVPAAGSVAAAERLLAAEFGCQMLLLPVQCLTLQQRPAYAIMPPAAVAAAACTPLTCAAGKQALGSAQSWQLLQRWACAVRAVLQAAVLLAARLRCCCS